jgi:putative nucleotidyltransferase with HDIG domain
MSPREGRASGRRRRFFLLVPPLGALILFAIDLLGTAKFPLVLLPKGSTSAYTLRATHDAVFDLHETFAVEAEEAKQSYLPIYNKDNLLLDIYKRRIQLSAQLAPPSEWSWPLLPEEEVAGGERTAPDGGNAGGALEAPADAGGASDATFEAGGPAPTPKRRIEKQRRSEIEALITGCFNLLEPIFQDGVVGDSEYPKEKKLIRIFSRGLYHVRPAAQIHRFSSLYSLLEQQGAQFFFKTDPRIREQVINFILQRLPPNLTYSKENQKFITDISQVTGVKVVLIRRGEVLARRGQVIDTRAFYAIQASVQAASAGETDVKASVWRFALVATVLFFLAFALREAGASPRAFLTVLVGLALLVTMGEVFLGLAPVHPATVPQAALALLTATVLGRRASIVTAIAVPAVLILVEVFDLSTLLVFTSGGITAALAGRHRRRNSTLAAGVLVGLAQALVFEACRAAEGRPRTWAELWSGGEAFLGGVASGFLTLAALPFAERFLGKSSRGKLRVLSDFDHPLARQLRERAPGTFAHTVSVMNLTEKGVLAIGAERLLAKAGALFHDVGKLTDPLFYEENWPRGAEDPGRSLEPEEIAAKVRAHVAEGIVLARRFHIPDDVAAFITEHHGTARLERLERRARDLGRDPTPGVFSYPGPKPRSLESAVLLLANALEQRTRVLMSPDRAQIEEVLDRVLKEKIIDFQFEECGITQAQLLSVRRALLEHLVSVKVP